MDEVRLSEAIEAAFVDHRPPERDRLLQTVRLEDDEIQSILRDFSGKGWREIPLKSVVRNHYALFFLTPEAFRFYLPAFLLALLSAHPTGQEVWRNLHSGLIAYLDGSSRDRRLWQANFDLLNEEQWEALLHLVEYQASRETDPFAKEDILILVKRLTAARAGDTLSRLEYSDIFFPFYSSSRKVREEFTALSLDAEDRLRSLPYLETNFARFLSPRGLRLYLLLIEELLPMEELASDLIQTLKGIIPRSLEEGTAGLDHLARGADVTENALNLLQSAKAQRDATDFTSNILLLRKPLSSRSGQNDSAETTSSERPSQDLLDKRTAIFQLVEGTFSYPPPPPSALFEGILPERSAEPLREALAHLQQCGMTPPLAALFFHYYQTLTFDLMLHLLPPLVQCALQEKSGSTREKLLARLLVCLSPARHPSSSATPRVVELVTELIALVHSEVSEGTAAPALLPTPLFYFYWLTLFPLVRAEEIIPSIRVEAIERGEPSNLTCDLLNVTASWTEVETILSEECQSRTAIDEELLNCYPELLERLRPNAFVKLLPQLLKLLEGRDREIPLWLPALFKRLKCRRKNVPYLLASSPQLRHTILEMAEKVKTSSASACPSSVLYHSADDDWFAREENTLITELDCYFWSKSVPLVRHPVGRALPTVELDDTHPAIPTDLMDHLRLLSRSKSLPSAFEMLEVVSLGYLEKILPLIFLHLSLCHFSDREVLSYLLEYLDPDAGSSVKVEQWKRVRPSVAREVVSFFEQLLKTRAEAPIDALLRPDWRSMSFWLTTAAKV